MLIEGQSFIDRQDELSVSEFMDKYGMPARVKDEIFIAMGKARSPPRSPPRPPQIFARSPLHLPRSSPPWATLPLTLT